MKKSFYLTMSLALCASLVACKSNQPAQQGSSEQTHQKTALSVGIVYDNGGLGDRSFNDGAAKGIAEAVKSLGIKSYPIESRSHSDYESNLTALAEKHVDLVFAVGMTMEKSVEKVASEFPQTKFAIIDATVNLPNVRSLVFKEQEGSFLAGYIAGLVSQTKKVGFVGGMEVPVILRFYSGFAAGAKAADHKLTVLPPKYTGDWANVDAAKTAANLLYAEGADVLFQAAGRAGLGVLKAAKEQHKLAIGVDSNQDDLYPGFVLTSMIKLVDISVYDTIKEVKEGHFKGGEKIFGLKEKGIGLSEMKHTRHLLTESDMKKLEQVQKEVVDGKIKVPSTPKELKVYLKTIQK